MGAGVRIPEGGLAGVGEPEGAEGGEDLVGFLEVELGDVVVVEDDDQVVGDDGGVVPVEGAVEDELAVDDAWVLVESRGWCSAAKRARGCGAKGGKTAMGHSPEGR